MARDISISSRRPAEALCIPWRGGGKRMTQSTFYFLPPTLLHRSKVANGNDKSEDDIWVRFRIFDFAHAWRDWRATSLLHSPELISNSMVMRQKGDSNWNADNEWVVGAMIKMIKRRLRETRFRLIMSGRSVVNEGVYFPSQRGDGGWMRLWRK